MELSLALPLPPSANRAWRHVGGRVLLSRAAREYRRTVAEAVARERLAGLLRPSDRLAVHLVLLPPDKRRRDIDNVRKQALDALTHAGLWADDSQIDRDSTERGELTAGGGLLVVVRTLGAEA